MEGDDGVLDKLSASSSVDTCVISMPNATRQLVRCWAKEPFGFAYKVTLLPFKLSANMVSWSTEGSPDMCSSSCCPSTGDFKTDGDPRSRARTKLQVRPCVKVLGGGKSGVRVAPIWRRIRCNRRIEKQGWTRETVEDAQNLWDILIVQESGSTDSGGTLSSSVEMAPK